MKLAATSGPNGRPSVELLLALEQAGYHSYWSAEDWGADAVSQLAWPGSHTSTLVLGTSIMQLPGRSPALTAMTAATLANLSGGRFILGLGPSGPQVSEGWHGVAYAQPLARLREYVGVVRQALDRTDALRAGGQHYQIPYFGPGASGLGKALRMNQEVRHNVPIFVSAMGPKALELAGEIADGAIATLVDPDQMSVTRSAIDVGRGRSGRTSNDFTLVVHAVCVVDDDVAACFERLRPGFARTLGGYGAASRNFYVDQVTRLGWGSVAARVQELYLAGRRAEAAAAIPDELIDAVQLVGPAQRIRDRARRYADAAVDVLMLGTNDLRVLRAVADIGG